MVGGVVGVSERRVCFNDFSPFVCTNTYRGWFIMCTKVCRCQNYTKIKKFNKNKIASSLEMRYIL